MATTALTSKSRRSTAYLICCCPVGLEGKKATDSSDSSSTAHKNSDASQESSAIALRGMVELEEAEQSRIDGISCAKKLTLSTLRDCDIFYARATLSFSVKEWRRYLSEPGERSSRLIGPLIFAHCPWKPQLFWNELESNLVKKRTKKVTQSRRQESTREFMERKEVIYPLHALKTGDVIFVFARNISREVQNADSKRGDSYAEVCSQLIMTASVVTIPDVFNPSARVSPETNPHLVKNAARWSHSRIQPCDAFVKDAKRNPTLFLLSHLPRTRDGGNIYIHHGGQLDAYFKVERTKGFCLQHLMEVLSPFSRQYKVATQRHKDSASKVHLSESSGFAWNLMDPRALSNSTRVQCRDKRTKHHLQSLFSDPDLRVEDPGMPENKRPDDKKKKKKSVELDIVRSIFDANNQSDSDSSDSDSHQSSLEGEGKETLISEANAAILKEPFTISADKKSAPKFSIYVRALVTGKAREEWNEHAQSSVLDALEKWHSAEDGTRDALSLATQFAQSLGVDVRAESAVSKVPRSSSNCTPVHRTLIPKGKWPASPFFTDALEPRSKMGCPQYANFMVKLDL